MESKALRLRNAAVAYTRCSAEWPLNPYRKVHSYLVEGLEIDYMYKLLHMVDRKNYCGCCGHYISKAKRPHTILSHLARDFSVDEADIADYIKSVALVLAVIGYK